MEVHRKILAKVFGIWLATFAVAPVANATPITTGEIQVVAPETGRGNFSFSIGDISVSGFFDEGTRLLLPGYEGSVFDGNHSLVGSTDMFYGYVDSQFVLWNKPGPDAGPVRTTLRTTAPGAILMPGQTVYQSMFDFEGSLCGSFVVNTPCDVIFPTLSGHGIAEFIFNESIVEDGRHLFTPISATYTFGVPEPQTLALFCAGLLAVVFAHRRRAIL